MIKLVLLKLPAALDRLCFGLGLGKPLDIPEYQLRGRWKEWFWNLVKWKPSLVLQDGEYLTRHWILPKNRWCNVYVHTYNGPDSGMFMHDHPWDNVSLILRGGLTEKRIAPPYDWELMVEHDLVVGTKTELLRYEKWAVIPRAAKMPHHIAQVDPGTITLFITGPATRLWGFHTLKGWVVWTAYKE